MEPQHNPWPVPWDHHHPPPPPPPPSTFAWPGPPPPPFSGDSFQHHHDRRRDFHLDSDHFAAPPDDSSSFSGDSSKAHFPRKRKFDTADGGNYVKLYVVNITRTATQEEILHLFEEHGNVLEVVLLNDKRTGQHQEYCFVKFASTEEADRAITALHNQFFLPGATAPIQVRYAVGEKERLGLGQHDQPLSRSGFAENDSAFSGPPRGPGLGQHDRPLPRSGSVQKDSTFSAPENGGVVHKVYVNGLNKEASQQEILDIFSSYGVVADVYILRDGLKQSRGCGFVGFAHRYMAVAAINGLNGTYVMRGCDRPLIVRFADPKKPKFGDARPAPNSMDMRGNYLPNGPHLGNSCASRQKSTTIVQAGVFAPVRKQLQSPAPSEMHQPPCQQPFSPSKISWMSLEQSQTSQSSQLHRDAQSNSVVHSSEPAPCAISGSDLSIAPVDCDWSEHICPDGQKYFFNCVTFESRWQKPEEFGLYEQQLRSWQLQKSRSQEHHPSSTSDALREEGCHTEAEEHQRQSSDVEKPQLPVSCAVEHSHEQVQVETSPSAFVSYEAC